MLVTKIADKQYYIPQKWDDITLDTFLDFFLKVEPFYPQCMKDLKEMQQEDQSEAIELWTSYDMEDILNYQVRYVCHFGNIPLEIGQQIKTKDIRAMYLQLESWLSVLPNSDSLLNVIEFNGENWYLPTRYMQDSTFIEFVEAAQFERQMETLKKQGKGLDKYKNKYHALPNILCILLRKKDEGYSAELMKRRELFLKMPMNLVFHVAFFLMRLNNRLGIDSQIFTRVLQIRDLKKTATF